MSLMQASRKIAVMHGYTHDVESTELTSEELAEFAHFVKWICNLQDQRQLARTLAQVTGPKGEQYQDYAQRQARRMWRTEVRL